MKEITWILVRKEEFNQLLFANDMILYLEDPKNSTRKLLELISEFSKVAGYKISTHKSNAFLYISNESIASEIRKTTFFLRLL